MQLDFAQIAALVERSRTGEAEARSELCRQTYDMVYYTALKMLRNPDDALDAVQEAYLRAFANLDRLGDPRSFVRWLSQIVGNVAKDMLKKKKPALFAELQKEEDSVEPEFVDGRERLTPQGSLEDAETRRLVAAMVEELPEDQRLCVLMYYYNELSVVQIAATLGVSENTVKSRLNYARQKVKAQVLELERSQGIKLYGLAPMPLLVWALRSQAAATAMPAQAAGKLLAAVTGQAMAAVAGAGTGAAAGSAGSATGGGGAATGSAAATTGGTAAGSAAQTVTATAAKAVSAKLMAGVAAGVVALAGVGYGIYQATRPPLDPLAQLQSQILEELEELGSAARSYVEDAQSAVEDGEAPEPVEIDPLAWLEVEFQGLSGLGRYQVTVEDPEGLVRVEADAGQGALRNGDQLPLQFSLQGETSARQRSDYTLATRSHTVTVTGLLEPPRSLEGVDHAALDAAMLELCLEKVEGHYPSADRSLTYETRVVPRTGYYRLDPENPAQNLYVTCYDLYFTRSNGGTGTCFLYVWVQGVYVEDGVLHSLEENLRWNQIGVYKDGAPYDEEEALEYVRRFTGTGASGFEASPVEPQF